MPNVYVWPISMNMSPLQSGTPYILTPHGPRTMQPTFSSYLLCSSESCVYFCVLDFFADVGVQLRHTGRRIFMFVGALVHIYPSVVFCLLCNDFYHHAPALDFGNGLV